MAVTIYNKSKLMISFKNIHAGERCFLVGNGPSINKTDLSLLKNENTFGFSRVYFHETFSPKYYLAESESFLICFIKK